MPESGPSEAAIPNDITWGEYSDITKDFTNKAKLGPFGPSTLPPCVRPESYNNDLDLGSFRPIKYTWSGNNEEESFHT